MARIETYPLDGNISVNDYVIGTDGDSLNATKNYKVLTFLDYLGRLYNLNSTDLLFNYSAVTPAAVADGEVSTNNYLDGTILMSGVTNIYVSKISAFGQLVDDIINTTGSENLTIMFTDMGNRNNLGIFVVDSAVDFDANTINLTVTSSTSVGSIDAGKVMGIRIGIGGGGGLDFTTLATDVDVLVFPTTNATNVQIGGGLGNGIFFTKDGDVKFFKDNAIGGLSNNNVTLSSNNSSNRTYNLPDKNGTFAMLDDVPTISGASYNATTWNGNPDGATKNAIRDEFESIRNDLVPLNIYSDFKKTMVNGEGLGSTGGFSSSSLSDITKPLQFKYLVEAQGADLANLIFTIEVATSSTPSNYTLPTLATSTATQPIIVEGEFSHDGTVVTLVGKIIANSQILPFFQTYTGTSGTAWEVRITNPTASGGSVRQQYYHYWQ